MILTKEDMKTLRKQLRVNISAEQERKILERFGDEPDDEHEWTWQDISEQVRKILSP